tara:strand:- start:436 stop:1035 length:600 start_codon:yes stop_codon:yes gene_type:complete
MKHKKTYAVAIIPAKTDSTRLPKKNLQVINGKTLIEHTIDYALDSEYIKDIVVSTESTIVKNLIETKYKTKNILVLDRPKHLLKDAEVADVYVDIFQNHTVESLKITSNATHMVALQPDNPDRNHKIDKVIDYFIDNTYDDLVTVSDDGTRNGASRITKAEYVRNGSMSRRMGTYLDNCTNIHSEDDLKQAERNIQNNE